MSQSTADPPVLREGDISGDHRLGSLWQNRLLTEGCRIRRALLLTLCFGMPTFFLWGYTFDAFNLPKLALLAALISAIASIRVLEGIAGRGWAGLDRLGQPAAFLVLPLLISWGLTSYKGWSLLGQYGRYEGLIPYLLVILAGILLADAFPGEPRPLAAAFVAGAAAAGLFALVQAVGLDLLRIPIADHSVASTVGHPNFLGGLLAVALPLSLGLWSWRRYRYMSMAATVAISIGLVLTLSQGPWLAGIAGLAVFGGLRMKVRWRHAPSVGFLAAAAIAVLMVGAVLYTQLGFTTSLDLGTSRARGLWWRAAIDMWSDAPIFGHGPNVYALQSSQYRLPLDALAHENTYTDNPHSVAFAFLANTGFVGLLGYLAVAAWSVRKTLRLDYASPLAAAFSAAVVAYFIQGLVSLDRLLLAFSLWIGLAGLSVAAQEDFRKLSGRVSEPTRFNFSVILVVGLILLGAVAGTWHWSSRLIEADHLLEKAALVESSPATLADGARRAIEVRDVTTYRHLYGRALGRQALEEGRSGADELQEMHAAFSYLKDLPDIAGLTDYGFWLHQWSVFDLEVGEQAVAVYRRIIRLDPYNPRPRLVLAEALFHLNRPREAIDILQPMLELLDLNPQASRRRSEIIASMALGHILAGDDRRGRLLLSVAAREGPVDATTSTCAGAMAGQHLLQDTSAPRNQRLRILCSGPMLELVPQ